MGNILQVLIICLAVLTGFAFCKAPIALGNFQVEDLETYEAAHDKNDFDTLDQCEIDVLIINIQGFQTRNETNAFCSPFFDFCSSRRFGERSWEGSFRFRHTFRGRDRRDSWDQYHNFIGRNNFHRSGFRHQFQFRGC